MSAFIDLTGQRFGRWTALKRLPVTKGKHTAWLCRCDCGRERVVRAGHLRGGYSRSCACYRVAPKHGAARGDHRQFSGAYKSWRQMRSRVLNRGHKNYHHYGGRGITICERWGDFAAFLADMGERPVGMSLDRIDVNGNYEPGNCRWASQAMQTANRRNCPTCGQYRPEQQTFYATAGMTEGLV